MKKWIVIFIALLFLLAACEPQFDNKINDMVQIAEDAGYSLYEFNSEEDLAMIQENTIENAFESSATLIAYYRAVLDNIHYIHIMGFESNSQANEFADAIDEKGNHYVYVEGNTVVFSEDEDLLDLFIKE